MKSRFYYAGIRVRDLKRSINFYTRAFGMKVVARGTMPHGGKYVHLVTPGSRMRLELNWYPKGAASTCRIGRAKNWTTWPSSWTM